ncbi:IS5 family transposase [Saccharomonospora marina]|uniref:IS5 family transposase n=1 Tax=Saccharomonospora marina TaxID=632569 RepID=UPI0022B6E36F|nr:IS5 family transposase [Saccharomonospora marina]
MQTPRRPHLPRTSGPRRLPPRTTGPHPHIDQQSPKKGGSLTGPSPVDRGKLGSKIHVVSDRGGLPLTVAISAANTHDSLALKPLVMAIPAVKSRRGPRRRRPAKLHADKAYDIPALRDWVREQGIAVRIARKGIESAKKLGQHRWVIERTMAWLTGYRRLTLRYERKAEHFLAFLQLGSALSCWKKLRKAST